MLARKNAKGKGYDYEEDAKSKEGSFIDTDCGHGFGIRVDRARRIRLVGQRIDGILLFDDHIGDVALCGSQHVQHGQGLHSAGQERWRYLDGRLLLLRALQFELRLCARIRVQRKQ